MWRFSLFGFPVGVDWWFWLTCLFLGGGLYAQTPEEWMGVIVFALVAFVSILVHELGHALSAQRYGAAPAIKLHAFGGLTFLPGARFSRGQSILVSASGPAAGLALGALLYLVQPLFADAGRWLGVAVFYGIRVNILWSILNLLPIQPLDGGQILREALGPTRLKTTAMIGFVLAAALGVWALTRGYYLSAVFLGLFAYHNLTRQTAEGGVIKG